SSDLRGWLADHLERNVSTTDLVSTIGRRVAELALAAARAKRDELVSQLRLAVGNRKVVPQIGDLLEGLLAENAEAVATAINGLHDERARRKVHQAYVDFITSVRQSAPMLAEAIVSDEGTERWSKAFADFEAAWGHR